MNARAAAEILALHQRHGLSFKDSVLFLIKAAGFDIGTLEKEAGRTRSTIHQALNGACQPTDAVRRAVKRRIGLDPWEWQVNNTTRPASVKSVFRRSNP